MFPCKAYIFLDCSDEESASVRLRKTNMRGQSMKGMNICQIKNTVKYVIVVENRIDVYRFETIFVQYN